MTTTVVFELQILPLVLPSDPAVVKARLLNVIHTYPQIRCSYSSIDMNQIS